MLKIDLEPEWHTFESDTDPDENQRASVLLAPLTTRELFALQEILGDEDEPSSERQLEMCKRVCKCVKSWRNIHDKHGNIPCPDDPDKIIDLLPMPYLIEIANVVQERAMLSSDTVGKSPSDSESQPARS